MSYRALCKGYVERWVAGGNEGPDGDGTRMPLALNEMPLIVPTILQKFRLTFAPDQPRDVVPEPLLAIRPTGGLRMTLAPRS